MRTLVHYSHGIQTALGMAGVAMMVLFDEIVSYWQVDESTLMLIAVGLLVQYALKRYRRVDAGSLVAGEGR